MSATTSTDREATEEILRTVERLIALPAFNAEAVAATIGIKLERTAGSAAFTRYEAQFDARPFAEVRLFMSRRTGASDVYLRLRSALPRALFEEAFGLFSPVDLRPGEDFSQSQLKLGPTTLSIEGFTTSDAIDGIRVVRPPPE